MFLLSTNFRSPLSPSSFSFFSFFISITFQSFSLSLPLSNCSSLDSFCICSSTKLQSEVHLCGSLSGLSFFLYFLFSLFFFLPLFIFCILSDTFSGKFSNLVYSVQQKSTLKVSKVKRNEKVTFSFIEVSFINSAPFSFFILTYFFSLSTNK